MSEGHRTGRTAPAVVTWLLWSVVGAILVQATLAGLFLSVAGGARLAHTIVGWLLPWLALILAGVTVAVRTRLSRGVAVAVYVLPVLLWIQEVLGHVPQPVTTAVHVPLGVALAIYSTVLAIRAGSCVTHPVRATPPSAAR